MSIPRNLKHKPIYYLGDIEKIDGNYRGDTDVKFLSLGKAQWISNADDFVPSVKVLRQNENGRWSPQSEETTLTRALDLATLIIRVINHEDHERELTFNRDIHGENKINKLDEYSDELKGYLKNNKTDIDAHIQVLKEALNDYREVTL